MNFGTLAIGAAAALALLAPDLAAEERQWSQGDMPYAQKLSYNLGSAGLLTSFNNFATFGLVQGRIGLSRAQYSHAELTSITSGYEDNVDVGIVPIDALRVHQLGSGSTFLKFGALGIGAFGRPNLTTVDTRIARIEAQFLHSLDLDTLYAIGVFAEATDINLLHNGGEVDRSGIGFRADYLRKYSDNWGFAGRGEVYFSELDTRVPLGGGLTYAKSQREARVYLQGEVVGTFTSQSARWVPEGWVARPTFGALYQHSDFETVIDSFGGISSGTVGDYDEYATVSAHLRMEKADYRPVIWAPYFDVGIEHEVLNGLDEYLEDPTILHLSLGASMMLKSGGRIDLGSGPIDLASAA